MRSGVDLTAGQAGPVLTASSAVVEPAESVGTARLLDVSLMAHLRDQMVAYLQLTKPRIVMLFALTGLSAMVMEGSLRSDPLRFWLIFVGIVLTAGSANALNQYLDRDIDAVMERTRKKRPLPSGRLTPNQALFLVLRQVPLRLGSFIALETCWRRLLAWGRSRIISAFILCGLSVVLRTISLLEVRRVRQHP